ncbi:hypothetical protein [Cytobacillus massiliigabonensis]|uniref:hypothetical protein n=1 Tax=Cytobacillus massiliigabonensis TaxID=1871011 RepID=UPI001C10374C|nr:hypothetical protein [Cytobacillus massiliigabonensis]
MAKIIIKNSVTSAYPIDGRPDNYFQLRLSNAGNNTVNFAMYNGSTGGLLLSGTITDFPILNYLGVELRVTCSFHAYLPGSGWFYSPQTFVGKVQSDGVFISDVRFGSGYTIDTVSIGEIFYNNTEPTTPGAFISPAIGTVLKVGETVTVAWGASFDAEGYPITYYPFAHRNGAVVPISLGNGGSTSRTYTIPEGTTSLKFTVQANDGTINSAIRESSVFTVIPGNKAPTLILNTANNLSLSVAAGQNEILVEGTAKDTDANNTVTVKVQFNDGTIRNIESKISDGSTPIPFSKRFTYKDKKIYDGETPLTVDLAENIDHKLKVWADDGAGGSSTIEERNFRVIHNRPPVISDSDRDLGTLIESPSVTYQVNDPEGQVITVTEKINGQVIRTFEATPNTDYSIEIPLEMWIPLQLQQHTLTVEAVDTFGAKSIRTFTFTRTEDTILLELKNPFVTDIAATRVLVTPDVYVPIGSTIKIEACNNAFDDAPTWEDITGMAMNKRGYTFTNTVKTAEHWGINIRFTLNKGTATQQVRFEGFGGAFD